MNAILLSCNRVQVHAIDGPGIWATSPIMQLDWMNILSTEAQYGRRIKMKIFVKQCDDTSAQDIMSLYCKQASVTSVFGLTWKAG